MRFTDPGGPILFPVSYIDGDVSVVQADGGSGADVNVQISASDGDAEERVSDGSVDLVGQQLDLVTATAAVGNTLVTRRVTSQVSNAEERSSDGDVITANQIGSTACASIQSRFPTAP
jgi:hypothetical protein